MYYCSAILSSYSAVDDNAGLHPFRVSSMLPSSDSSELYRAVEPRKPWHDHLGMMASNIKPTARPKPCRATAALNTG